MERPVGAKRVTLAQVAARAGVSVMTASYTYNRPGRVSDQARSKVLAAAAELGYAGPDPSARSLRRGSTRTLGVVLGEHLSYAFDDPQAVSFLAGIADVCAGRGYGMTILPITGAADDVPRIQHAAVDGFIVWTTSDDDPVLAAVRATRRAAVVHGAATPVDLPTVAIDNRAAARAIGVLAFAGARRPAVLSQPLDRSRNRSAGAAADLGHVAFPVTRDRLAGFRDATEDVGLVWDEVVVAVCSRNGIDEAESAAMSLLTSPVPPDAIAAMGDQQAIGVLRAARSLGLGVPEDVAVTGFDDLPAAEEHGLTTIAQSLRAQGSTCAHVALGHDIQATEPPWSVVVRRTTIR
jgi:DNA-binding LacI/PurR family transcriptional regulator